MTNDLTNSIDRYFQQGLIESLAVENGIPQETFLQAARTVSLLSVHQIKIRLENPDTAMGTYRFARVAARSRVRIHLKALYDGETQYQGIANMTRVIYAGDLSAITQMVAQHFAFSTDVSNRLVIMSTSAMLSLLGETLVEKKMKQAAFTQHVMEQIPFLEQALTVGAPFPFGYWEAKQHERENRRFKVEKRRIPRSREKKSAIKMPVKMLAAFVGFVYMKLLLTFR